MKETDIYDSYEDTVIIGRWVKRILLLGFIIFISVYTIQSYVRWKDSNPAFLKVDRSNLTMEREQYQTKLMVKGVAPQYYETEIPPANVKEIEYQSGDLALKAWLLNDPGDGTKHPALVYVHGGFSFSSEDWEITLPYINSGYIVMIPMLRGENGNPGYFEFFYGEVDDVIAAGEYLSNISYVDKDNIFLSGHSSGGTLVMLVSSMESPYKAVATFGAIADQVSFLKGSWGNIAPFDTNNLKEVSLRSPLEFVESLQIPLYMYVGGFDFTYLEYNKAFKMRADELSKPCDLIVLEGDHFSTLSPAIERSIEKFSEILKNE